MPRIVEVVVELRSVGTLAGEEPLHQFRMALLARALDPLALLPVLVGDSGHHALEHGLLRRAQMTQSGPVGGEAAAMSLVHHECPERPVTSDVAQQYRLHADVPARRAMGLRDRRRRDRVRPLGRIFHLGQSVVQNRGDRAAEPCFVVGIITLRRHEHAADAGEDRILDLPFAGTQPPEQPNALPLERRGLAAFLPVCPDPQ